MLQWHSGFSSGVACSNSAAALFAAAQGGAASAAQWQKKDCCSGTSSGCAWGRAAVAQQCSCGAGDLLQLRSGFRSGAACSDSAAALFAAVQGERRQFAAQWQEDCCSGTVSGCAWGGQQRRSNAAVSCSGFFSASGTVVVAVAQRGKRQPQRAATAQQRYCSGAGGTAAVRGAAGSEFSGNCCSWGW